MVLGGPLQIRTTGAPEYGRYIKALIAGNSGVGKTLISSTFPSPVYASAEGGLMSVADRKIPYVDIKHTNDLQELLLVLLGSDEAREAAGLHNPKTVVVDTIDEVARMFVRERLSMTNKDQMAMADWGWLGDQMRGLIRAFRNLPMHVVFTCHLKQTEDGESGRIFFKPAIQGAVGDEISGYVDLALLLDARTVAELYEGGTRQVVRRNLITSPQALYPWIKDRSGKLPPAFPVDFVDDFQRMFDLIFSDMIAPHVDRVPLEPPVVDAPEVADVPEVVPEGELVLEPPLKAKTTKLELSAMGVSQKLRAVGPWECEECSQVFDAPSQRDSSVVAKQRVLCATCSAT
jgi:hypothetical protein